jgi:hypothetical protein
LFKKGNEVNFSTSAAKYLTCPKDGHTSYHLHLCRFSCLLPVTSFPSLSTWAPLDLLTQQMSLAIGISALPTSLGKSLFQRSLDVPALSSRHL